MEIEQKYERKMRALRDELDLRRKTELHEVEERKNAQINTLMRNHEKAFSDIKNYYNDITLNNLALINTLKVTLGILTLSDVMEMKTMLHRTSGWSCKLNGPIASDVGQRIVAQLGCNVRCIGVRRTMYRNVNKCIQEGPAVASIVRDDPSTLPGDDPFPHAH